MGRLSTKQLAQCNADITITFGSRPLGFKINEHRAGLDAVITKVKHKVLTDAGLKDGDILISIDSERVQGYRFKQILHFLQTAHLPFQIGFCHPEAIEKKDVSQKKPVHTKEEIMQMQNEILNVKSLVDELAASNKLLETVLQCTESENSILEKVREGELHWMGEAIGTQRMLMQISMDLDHAKDDKLNAHRRHRSDALAGTDWTMESSLSDEGSPPNQRRSLSKVKEQHLPQTFKVFKATSRTERWIYIDAKQQAILIHRQNQKERFRAMAAQLLAKPSTTFVTKPSKSLIQLTPDSFVELLRADVECRQATIVFNDSTSTDKCDHNTLDYRTYQFKNVGDLNKFERLALGHFSRAPTTHYPPGISRPLNVSKIGISRKLDWIADAIKHTLAEKWLGDNSKDSLLELSRETSREIYVLKEIGKLVASNVIKSMIILRCKIVCPQAPVNRGKDVLLDASHQRLCRILARYLQSAWLSQENTSESSFTIESQTIRRNSQALRKPFQRLEAVSRGILVSDALTVVYGLMSHGCRVTIPPWFDKFYQSVCSSHQG